MSEQSTRTAGMADDDKSFLGREPIGKLLLRLAIPTVVAQLINMLYNIVDRIYIGHMPEDGQLALTGLGVCLPLILLVSAFAALIANGGAPRASIFMGKGDTESAERTLGNCFVTQIIISVVLTAVLLIFDEQFLWLFGASENTIGYAVDYMNIYAIGTIFVQLTLGMNAFITAQGFATTGMLSVLIGAVANIGLDPLFIYAFGMGGKGRRSCDDYIAGRVMRVGTVFSVRKENGFENPSEILQAESRHYSARPCPRLFHIRNAGERKHHSYLF